MLEREKKPKSTAVKPEQNTNLIIHAACYGCERLTFYISPQLVMAGDLSVLVFDG